MLLPYVVQDDRIRRLSPLETERLMGFPDNYTDLPKARKTNRYQATGNSWAVPVVKWLGKRIIDSKLPTLNLDPVELYKKGLAEKINDSTYLMLFGKIVSNLVRNFVPEKSHKSIMLR